MDTDDVAARIRLTDPAAAAASAPRPAAPQAGPSFAPPPKLEPFLLLAKSARGAGAAKLIEQATAAPGVYVFAELIESSCIVDLASNDQFASQYRLLQLFAYGTWRHYREREASYPVLNAAQTTKLKQLSLISLAKARTLPYTLLLDLLEIADVRELEDLIIETIYAGLIKGRLDQRRQRFDVEWVTGRDVEPALIESLAKELHAWSNKIEYAIGTIDQQIKHVQDRETYAKNDQQRYGAAVDKLIAELGPKAGGGSHHAGPSYDFSNPETIAALRGGGNGKAKEDVMDVDGPEETGAGRGRGGKGTRKRTRN